MTARKRKKNNKGISYQTIINTFLFSPPASSSDWGKEMKFAVKLCEEHGIDFLFSLRGKKKMPSLCWFMTEDGKKFLKNSKACQNLNFQPDLINLENQPVAPLVEVDKKPKTLKDFLNIFNNKNYGKTQERNSGNI